MSNEKVPSYVFNTIIVVIFVISFLVLICSFLWNPPLLPSDKQIASTRYFYNGVVAVTSNSSVSGCQATTPLNYSVDVNSYLQTSQPQLYDYLVSNGVPVNSSVYIVVSTVCLSAGYVKTSTSNTPVYVFIASIMFGILCMNWFVLTSSRGNTPNLALYSCAACIFCFTPLAMAILVLVLKFHLDTIGIVRVVFLFACFACSCFITIGIYVTNITERWITTSTTHWSDGSRTSSTQVDNFGYVKCRRWPCLQR